MMSACLAKRWSSRNSVTYLPISRCCSNPIKKSGPRFREARSYTTHSVHPAAMPSWFHIVTLLLSNRQLWPHVLTSSAHFISTATFSVQLHKLHSKVRTSGPSGPDTTPVSIIGPGILDMVAVRFQSSDDQL